MPWCYESLRARVDNDLPLVGMIRGLCVGNVILFACGSTNTSQLESETTNGGSRVGRLTIIVVWSKGK